MMQFCTTHIHDGESRDFIELKMADAFQKPSFQLRLSLIVPLMLIRLAWGLNQINESNMFRLVTLRQRSVVKNY